MCTTKKVAVVQPFLAHYREHVYALLCRQDDIEFTFFADVANTYNSVKTIDPQKAAVSIETGGIRWKFVKNRWLFKHLLLQSSTVKLALSREFHVLIYPGNVHFISTWIGAILARLTGKRVLMWSHGFLRDEKGIKGRVRKTFYKLAHGMLLYHHRAREIMINKGFKPENLYVVYNSLDYDTQVRIRNEISQEAITTCRQKLFKNPNLPVLLFIGRLTPQKKLTMIIEAAKILKGRGRTCNILFVGEGSEREKLLEQAKDAGLSDYLCLYGACYDERDISLLISASDICVAPGEIGLTCMHALVFGTPIITHNDPDFQMPEYEAIKAGYNGTFFPKGNVEYLAETIDRWLEDNKDRTVVAARCHEAIDQYYNPHYQVQVIKAAVLGAAI